MGKQQIQIKRSTPVNTLIPLKYLHTRTIFQTKQQLMDGRMDGKLSKNGVGRNFAYNRNDW